MTASAVGYEQVRTWVEVMLGQTHATVVRTTAWIVLAVLTAQRVTAAALARALPADQGGSGRARLTRVRRWWTGPPLEQTVVSPQLIRAALMLLASGQPVVVALDTTRLGPWEVWLAGLVVQGRTVPIGWAVIPYPWPKGRFRTTTVALIQQLQRAFPPSVLWSVVADRGFPRAALFAQLRQAGTSFSVRLRLNTWVTVAGVYAMDAEHLQAGRLVVGQRTAAVMGCGRRDQPLVPGWIAVARASRCGWMSRSTSRASTPWRASSAAANSPDGPAPTIRTSPRVTRTGRSRPAGAARRGPARSSPRGPRSRSRRACWRRRSSQPPGPCR